MENMGINLKNQNILVTGGTGFIGSHLIEGLVGQKCKIITTFQTLSPGTYFYTQKLNLKVKMILTDVCDFDQIFHQITKHQIDYIFHLAAQPLVETAYYNPKMTLKTNILGTINVLESARLFPKVKGVVIASSDKAYGKLAAKTARGIKTKYLETDPLNGDHPYEVSKSSADLIAQAYFKTYNVPVIITRFGNVYGEGDLNFDRLIPGIMEAMINKGTLEIRSNGKYRRDYLYVKDVVKGYLLLLQHIDKVKGQAFNFGSKDNYSVIDLITLIEKILKKKVSYKILRTAKNEIPYQSLDYSKAVTLLKWQPKNKLAAVINKVYQWYNKTL